MQSEVITLIKSLGFRAFQPAGDKEYAFYTDGTHIGYAQWSRMAVSVSTVHAPCRECGTGFVVADKINVETLKQGFMHSPDWATGSDRRAVKKYRDWAAFEKAHSGRGYPTLIEV